MSSGDTTRAITAPRSTRRSLRSRRTTSRGCASPGGGLSSIPRCSNRIRSCARPTTSARRRSWSAACCMRRTASAWSRRSIRRPAGRSGCSRCRRASCPSAAPIAASRTGARAPTARILTFRNQYLYALDAQNRRAGRGVRHRRARRSHGRHGRRAAPTRWNGAPLVVRDVVVLGSSMADQDSAAQDDGDARRRARLRRAHRAAALDVPRPIPTRRRARHRDLGERVVALHRRRATSGRR